MVKKQVLLIEDNSGDQRLTVEALKEQTPYNLHLELLHDGVEAMEYLRREGRFSSAIQPDLILLDLNLPRKDGRTILAEIKSDDNLKQIPVVILTTSEAEDDIRQCYQHHANCYLTKPVELDRYFRTIQSICDFWLETVRLPNS